MVVHDMRNPATSIDFGLGQSIDLLNKLEQKFEIFVKLFETRPKEEPVEINQVEDLVAIEAQCDFDDNIDETEIANIPIQTCHRNKSILV